MNCFDCRTVAFCDEGELGFLCLARNDVIFDYSRPVNWKKVRKWAENKDIFLDFSAQNKRYAVAFARHLLAETYRPATLHVRDMTNYVFSIARFDGREKIVLDQLNIFRLENGCVSTR